MRGELIRVTAFAALLLFAGSVSAQLKEVKGVLRADVFSNITSPNSVASVTGDPRYPDNPSESRLLKFFEYPPGGDDGSRPPGDVANNYGARLWGWLTPKETAQYEFFVASDDMSEVWLSTDDSPANKRMIAREPEWNGIRNWTGIDRRPGCPDNGGQRCDNRSEPIQLEANKRYFIEAIFREGLGGDNLAVTWIKSGEPDPDGETLPISGEFLSAMAESVPQILEQPDDVKVEIGGTATFDVKMNLVLGTFQWFKNGSPIAGATGPSYTTPELGANDSAKYKVAVTVDGNTVESREATLTVVPIESTFTKGFVRVQLYRDIPGNPVQNLLDDPDYPANPDETFYWNQFGTDDNITANHYGDNYGGRATALLVPPVTGEYKFYIRSDDNSQLYLSSDESPLNALLIAEEFGCCKPFTDEEGTLSSFPVQLQAGKRYYIEALWKEGGGGDGLQVGWRIPGEDLSKPPTGPIPGTFLVAEANPHLASDVTINAHPQSQTVAAPNPVTFTVDATINPPTDVSYQWQKNGQDIPGATGTSFTTDWLTTADNGAKYRVVISVPGAAVNSNEATLTVTPDTIPPKIVSVTGSESFTEVTVNFNEPVTAASAGTAANYSISGGLTVSAATVVDETTVKLTTSKQAVNTDYTLTVSNVRDTGNNAIAAPDNSKQFRSFALAQGIAIFEAYNNIPGNPVQNLIDAPKFQEGRPDFVTSVPALNSRLVYPDDRHEAYGGRMRAFFTPKQSGDYEFFVRSDDASQLFLSSDDTRANLTMIAEETGCCGGFEESGAPETSAPVSLVAGKQYLIEVLWKEGGGGDFAQVAFRRVGDTTAAGSLSPIPGEFLSVFVDPQGAPVINQPPASQTVAVGSSVTFTVAAELGAQPFTYEWTHNGEVIAGATGPSLSLNNVQPADAGAYVVTVSNAKGEVSAQANLLLTGQPVTFGPFIEENGLTVIEAENFHAHTPKGAHLWTISAAVPGFTGSAFLESSPNIGANQANYPDLLDNSPRLDYKVRFASAGTRYVWIRGWALGGSDDSLHAGINGDNPESARRIDRGFTPNTWVWVGEIQGTNPDTGDFKTTVNVPSAGEHTFNIWMREDGTRIDKIILTTDAAFRPSGDGPAESDAVGGKPQPASISIARGAAGIQITFTGTLESADSVTGPWTPVANATSPFTVNVTGTAKFYRAR